MDALKTSLSPPTTPGRNDAVEYQGVQSREQVLNFILGNNADLIDLDPEDPPVTLAPSNDLITPPDSSEDDSQPRSTFPNLPSRKHVAEDEVETDKNDQTGKKRRLPFDFEGSENPWELLDAQLNGELNSDRSREGYKSNSKQGPAGDVFEITPKSKADSGHPLPACFSFEDKSSNNPSQQQAITEAARNAEVERAKRDQENASIARSQQLRASRQARKNGRTIPTGTDEDDEDLSEYFDTLIEHTKAEKGLETDSGEHRQRVPAQKARSDRFHPYSRQAAESWRTQSRHLGSSATGSKPRSHLNLQTKAASTTISQQDRKAVKQRWLDQLVKKISPADQTREPDGSRNMKRFYAVDLETKSSKPKGDFATKASSQSLANTGNQLKKLMGTHETHRTDQRQNPTKQNDTSTTIASGWEQLKFSSKPVDTSSTRQVSLPSDPFKDLPAQGDLKDFNFPKIYEKFNDEQKSLFIERQVKTERQQDLDLVFDVYNLGAQLAASTKFDPTENKTRRQFVDIGKFAEAVCIKDRSGKPVRDRIKSIRSSFKRRVESSVEPLDQKVVDQRLEAIVRGDIFEILKSELPALREESLSLKTQCEKIIKETHQKRRRSKPTQQFSTGSYTSPASRHMAALAKPSQDQKLKELYAARAQFETLQQPSDDVEIIDLGPSQQDGDVSEEDEGEDFALPLRTQQRSQETTDSTHGTQKIDQSLLRHMLAKQQQRAHLESQGSQQFNSQIAQSSCANDVEQETNPDEESSNEFDDPDIDEEEDEVEDEVHCYRYIVKAVCSGLPSDPEYSEYNLGNYLDRKRAIKEANEFTLSIKSEISKHHPDLEQEGFEESVSETKTSFEQKISYGDNNSIRSRAWVEQELYTPSEDAYQRAKVYKACQGPDVWFVDWERTIKPYDEADDDDNDEEGQAAASASNPSEAEGSRQAKPGTKITQATGNHIRYFSCLALANRHAKDIFMNWYKDRLPGYHNFGFIEHEDRMMEEELQRMGSLSPWSRQEDFIETNADGDGDGGKVNDEFRVWVRKSRVYGPAN